MRNMFTIIMLFASVLAGCGDNNGVSNDKAEKTSTIFSFNFDESSGSTVNNSANNYIAGTIYGASRVGGKVGSALKFDSPTARVDVSEIYIPGSAPTSIGFAGDLISIEAWVNPSSITNGVTKRVIGSDESFILQLNGGKIEFKLTDRQNFNSIIMSNQDLTINTWYHIAVTYDGTVAKIFINGTEDSSKVISFRVNSVANEITIGSGYSGIIDEVKLHNLLLTQKEISDYYLSTK